MDVGALAGALVVGIELVILNHERGGNAGHYGMGGILHMDRSVREVGDVVVVADTAEQPGEPVPHGETVELAQQRGMVEAHPAAAAFIDIALEGLHGLLRPAVRGIVQLDDDIEPVQVFLIEFPRIIDFRQDEILLGSDFAEPGKDGLGERFVVSGVFIEDQDTGRLRPAGEQDGSQQGEKEQLFHQSAV